MSVELQCFGAAGEVTGSKHMLTIDGQRLLLDCGMYQGRRDESYQRNSHLPFDATTLDAMVLSHGHFDHCGQIPMLVRHGYSGNVYSTPATRDIANLIMMDSAHIMAKDYEFLSKKKRPVHKPLYDSRDVLKTLEHFITVPRGRSIPILRGVKSEFLWAGHILGAAMTVLTIDREDGTQIKLGFSGDVGRWDMPIIPDPELLPDLDYLIMESTYGNRLHESEADAEQRLAEIINRTIKRGGQVVIPSFAVGRTQQMVYYMHRLRLSGAIPEVPVYVDSPMAVNATGVFRIHQECYDEETRAEFIDERRNPFYFSGLEYIVDVADSKRLNTCKEPCIIISSSGMCEAGRILHHLKHTIGDERNTIMIVGFMAEYTLGRRIVDGARQVRIFGEEYKVKAEVTSVNAFSAHGDRNDLLRVVSQVNRDRLKRVFLVHGEPDGLSGFRETLLATGVKDVVIPERGDSFTLG